jgi:hypothetical protein
MSTNIPGNLATTHVSAAAGVGVVIIDVDKDGVIEDGDSVVLVDNRRAAVSDIAFGKQEINHAWGDTHMSQADASSGYSQATELRLRGKAQDLYTQLLQGAGQAGTAASALDAFVAEARSITDTADAKFDFSSDIAFVSRNGVRLLLDVDSAPGGNAVATEKLTVQVLDQGLVTRVVQFDNIWLGNPNDDRNNKLEITANRNGNADDQAETTLPIIRALASQAAGSGAVNYGVTVNQGRDNFLITDRNFEEVIRSDGTVDGTKASWVQGFHKRFADDLWHQAQWTNWLVHAHALVDDSKSAKAQSAAGPVFDPGAVQNSPAVLEAQALSAKLANQLSKFDLAQINSLNTQGTWEQRMFYLYEKINGWTVVHTPGNYIITADAGIWGGQSRVGAGLHDERMRFSALRAESPQHFNWVESEIESFFAYDSKRGSEFATDEALVQRSDIFWHNASGVRGFLQTLRTDLLRAEQLLPRVELDAHPQTHGTLASTLRSQIDQLKVVGQALFRMSDEQPTPYIIDFAGDGIKTDDKYLQVGGNGSHTQWVKADAATDDAVLVYDRNGDGQVSGYTELLAARTEDTVAGQAALGQLDTTGDGLVDASDQDFAKLKLWFDRNGNGLVDSEEMQSLAQKGVMAFSVAYVANKDAAQPSGFKTDVNGNTHRYTADVHLAAGNKVQMTDVFFNAAT